MGSFCSFWSKLWAPYGPTSVSPWANCLFVVLIAQDRAKPAFVDVLFTIAYYYQIGYSEMIWISHSVGQLATRLLPKPSYRYTYTSTKEGEVKGEDREGVRKMP